MAAKALQTDGQKLVGYWIDQLEASQKWQRSWIDRSKRIIRRYKNLTRLAGSDAAGTDDGTDTSNYNRRFAILWSNIETLKPAVYGRVPQPVVTRRYRDPDPVGKYVADVLERGLKYTIDAYDFDERLQLCRNDYLLVARAQAWIRYVPHVSVQGQPEEDAEQSEGQITNDKEGEGAADAVTYQEVLCDHVAYDDWGMQPCRNWAETGYVWRRAFLTRQELIDRFGPELGKEIPLDWSAKTDESRDAETIDTKKAQIYEIWDKSSGKVIWVSKAYTTDVLDAREDPLGLAGFFPCPRPLMGTTPQDAYIPIPDYAYYQDQAEELDELTQRIGRLTNALRMVGVYAQENGVDLSNMFDGDQNTLIPIPSMSTLGDKGGLKGIIEWMPIDMVILTLKGCFETRRQILDDIYQITGLADIIRGESDPRETLGAQRIKGQWGSLRVRDRQREMARFARDLLDLKGQVIAAKFTPDTLKAMTDVKLLTAAEKQQIQQQVMLYQQAVQSAQASNMPPPPQPPMPPGVMDLMGLPTWDEVVALMRDKTRMLFRVDIETDSTIEPDESAARQNFTEYVGAVTQLLTAAASIVPGAPYTAPLFSEIFKESARVFNVSTTMEDTIDKVFEQAGQMQPAPPPPERAAGPGPEQLQLQQQDQQANHALESQRLQLDAQELAQSAAFDQADIQLRAQDQALKAQGLRLDPNPQSVT